MHGAGATATRDPSAISTGYAVLSTYPWPDLAREIQQEANRKFWNADPPRDTRRSHGCVRLGVTTWRVYLDVLQVQPVDHFSETCTECRGEGRIEVYRHPFPNGGGSGDRVIECPDCRGCGEIEVTKDLRDVWEEIVAEDDNPVACATKLIMQHYAKLPEVIRESLELRWRNP